MRIQIIGHAKEYNPKSFRMRWHRLPLLFEKFGHEVDHILIKEWKKFYLRYLKFRPDVIISVGLIGAVPAFFKKIKMIRKPLVHDWTDCYTDIMGKYYGIDRVAFFEHFIIKYSDYITTPSKFLEKRCELFGKKAYYIPHGVDSNFDRVEPVKLRSGVNVVYSGSVTEYKRTYELIKAVKGLDCNLYICGQVEIKLKNLPKNVHLVGVLKQDDVPRYLKSADILVITAEDDSTLKMFEYIKAGKPILALKGKVGYFLDNNVNALLVDDLHEGLKELINNKELRERLARNVKKIKIYTWEEIAKIYLKFLETVVR